MMLLIVRLFAGMKTMWGSPARIRRPCDQIQLPHVVVLRRWRLLEEFRFDFIKTLLPGSGVDFIVVMQEL